MEDTAVIAPSRRRRPPPPDVGVHRAWARTEGRRRRTVRAAWAGVASATVVLLASAVVPTPAWWAATIVASVAVAFAWPVGDLSAWAVDWITARDGLAYATAIDAADAITAGDDHGFLAHVHATARSGLRAGGAPPATRAWLTPAICATALAAGFVVAWDRDAPGTLNLGAQLGTQIGTRGTVQEPGAAPVRETPTAQAGEADEIGDGAPPSSPDDAPERGASRDDEPPAVPDAGAPQARDEGNGSNGGPLATGDDAVRQFLDASQIAEPGEGASPDRARADGSGTVPASSTAAPASTTRDGAVDATTIDPATAPSVDALPTPPANPFGRGSAADPSSPDSADGTVRDDVESGSDEGLGDAADRAADPTGEGSGDAPNAADGAAASAREPARPGDAGTGPGEEGTTTTSTDDRRTSVVAGDPDDAADADAPSATRDGADASTESRNPFSTGSRSTESPGGASASADTADEAGTTGGDGASDLPGRSAGVDDEAFARGAEGPIVRLDGDLADEGTTFVVPVTSLQAGTPAPPPVNADAPPPPNATAQAEIDAEDQGLPGAYRDIIRRYFRTP